MQCFHFVRIYVSCIGTAKEFDLLRVRAGKVSYEPRVKTYVLFRT